MKKDRQTKEKLLKAAKEEFLDKGYVKASLRSICRKAEVTTGAMYFFFQDKEDLFGSLVEGPLKGIYDLMENHYEEEARAGWDKQAEEMLTEEELQRVLRSRESAEHEKTAFRIVDYLYEYQDEFLLLLTKAQGSRYENCLDEFAGYTEEHFRQMAEVMDRITGKKGLDEDTLHCVVHMQLTVFTQPITHGLEKERARTQVAAMVKFLMGGWYGLWQ